MGATRTSPFEIFPISLGLLRIFTGPVPIPGEAGLPVKIGAWAILNSPLSAFSILVVVATVVTGLV